MVRRSLCSMPIVLYLMPALSGLLMAMAFTWNKTAFLAWLALLPFFYVLFRQDLSSRSGLVSGILYGMSFYLVLLQWLYEMLPLDWAGFSPVGSFLLMTTAWLLVCMLETVGFAFLGFLMGTFAAESKWKKLLLLTTLWLLVEWLQSLGQLTGFTWGRVAISQYAYTPLIQSASLFGSLGLSGLMVFFQGLLLCFFLSPGRRKRLWLFSALLLFLGNFSYGFYSLQKPPEASSSFTAAVVQGNYSSSQKYAEGSEQEIFAEYEKLSREVVAEEEGAPVDLVIWPETALSVAITEDITDKTRQRWIGLAAELHTDFLMGASLEKGPNQQNVLIYTSQSGRSDIVYAKRHLMPFGEYLPLRSFISRFIDFSQAIPKDTLPGTDHGIFQLPQGEMAGLICFDCIFPQLARKSVLAGAEILVLPTNDSWFRDSVALYQHNGQAVFRAVENAKTLLRAANAGVSSIIDEKGRILCHLQPGQSGFLIEKVVLNDKITLYDRIGDLPGWLALAYVLFAVFPLLRRRNGFHQEHHLSFLPFRRFF